jgi:hypothetical protein
MTRDKNDVSDPKAESETPKARGGAIREDKSKGPDFDQSDGIFGEQTEDKSAAEKKKPGEQKG